MIAFGVDCARHRAALLDFVDRRESGPATSAALDHLDRCAACTWELEATALAIMALRRLHDEVAEAEPAADGWGRLRARVTRPREAVWRWRASLAGVAIGAGLVATIIAPTSHFSARTTLLEEAGLEPGLIGAIRLAEQLEERAVLDQQRATRTGPVPIVRTVAPLVVPVVAPVATWAGPDGLGTGGRGPDLPSPLIVRSD
jgi:hypothetical protein